MRQTRTVIEISVTKTGDHVDEDQQADLVEAIRNILDLDPDIDIAIDIDDEIINV